MSIFTAVMLISVVSAYQSTYGFDLESIGNAVVIGGSGVAVNESLVGNNLGLSAVSLSILNKSFTLTPGQKTLGNFLVPLNLDKLSSMGYPTHNISFGVSVLGKLAALFFKLARDFALGQAVLPAPFGNFNVTGITETSNGSGIIHVAFNYFLPLVFHIAKIAVSSGNLSLGNISLTGLAKGFNSLSSNIQIPSGLNSLNLTFQAGPLQWISNNISLS